MKATKEFRDYCKKTYADNPKEWDEIFRLDEMAKKGDKHKQVDINFDGER